MMNSNLSKSNKGMKMTRQPNTTHEGHSFTPEWIEAVWRKGLVVAGYDSRLFRRDACNAWMKRSDYGQITTFGWEIDHIFPVAKGGQDVFQNLQPLNWQNNRHKGDSYPHWTCAISAAA